MWITAVLRVPRLWWSCWQTRHWKECVPVLLVHLMRSKIRDMSAWHENRMKTSCPPACWTDRERAVSRAEQSMSPPPLRPESYRFPLSVKRRCWWTEGAAYGNGRKGTRRDQKEGERQRGKPKVMVEVTTCLFSWLCLKPWPAELLPPCSGVWRSVPNLLLLNRNGVELKKLQGWVEAIDMNLGQSNFCY